MVVKTELQMKLKDLRLALGFTNQTSFAEKLGVTQATIANMESGNRDVSKPVLLKIKEVFDVDLISWRESQDEITVQSGNVVPIPFYSAKAAAGYGETLPDYPEKDIIYFDTRWLKNVLGVNPNNIAIIQAKGDSMDGGVYPIKDNDLLIVDDSIKELVNNNVFIIKINDTDLVVKKVIKEWDGTIKLISNNPKYEDRIIKESDNAEIIGKVIKNISRESI